MSAYSYHGNRKPYAAVLCHSGDFSAVEPVLAEIENRGLKLCLIDETAGKAGGRLKKACGVICVLTENFSGSESLQSGLLEAEAAGKSVIPVRTDGFDLPDFIKRMTYASNSVNISNYTPEKAAERILTAPALAEPKLTKEQSAAFRRAAALIAVAAVVIAAAVAVPMLRDRTAEPEEPETSGETVINLPGNWDLTEEDLAEITSIVLIGDRREESVRSSSYRDFVNENRDGDRLELYRSDDGSEVEPGSITDLSFLAQFPNLHTMVLVNQTAEDFPDLTGLEFLYTVELVNCAFRDINGLQANSLQTLEIYMLPNITDLSPLSECRNLTDLSCRDCGSIRSLEGFCPQNLTRLTMENLNVENINALSGLGRLDTLELCLDGRRTPLDLSPLAGCTELRELSISADRNDLDLAPLAAMSKLQGFSCNCRAVSNVEAVGQAGLNNFYLSLESGNSADLSFLSSCSKLTFLSLNNVETDLSFFRNMNRDTMSRICLSGERIECSGLSALKSIGELELYSFRSGISRLADDVRGVSINTLVLDDCGTLSASEIPEDVYFLEIRNCNITALEGLPGDRIHSVALVGLNRLTSLKGLENLDLSILKVEGCMHLTDWDAVYGRPLLRIEIANQFNLPDFGQLEFGSYAEIRLQDIPGMKDLNCLDAISDDTLAAARFSVDAIGSDIADLSALRRFNSRTLCEQYSLRLLVHPAAEELARELVSNGNFSFFELQSTEGRWEDIFENFSVTSLEELNTFPESVLSRIKQLFVIGDSVYEDGGWLDYRWDGDRKEYAFYPPDSDEEIIIDSVGQITGFSMLSRLTGLEKLTLACQPLDSLDGIQNLENLRELTIYGCPNITDYSPVFALGSLEQLRLEGEKVTSVEGVQNLYNLRELDLRDTYVADLSPLGEMSFSGEVCSEGFSLALPNGEGPEITDFSFLSAVPKFRSLQCFQDMGENWTEYLQGKEVAEAHMFCINDTETLEKFVSAVSGLEYLKISWQEGIDDLTCLLDCESLRTVCVSSNMTAAIKSLEGKNYSFELEYEG